VTFLSQINFKTGQPVNTETEQIMVHCGTWKREEGRKCSAVYFKCMKGKRRGAWNGDRDQWGFFSYSLWKGRL